MMTTIERFTANRVAWAAVGAVLLLAACQGPQEGPQEVTQEAPQEVVTDVLPQDSGAADWPMWRRTPDGWGYSPLDQITPQNVAGLERVWSQPIDMGIQ